MNILFYIPELNQKWGGIKQYSATLLQLLNRDHQNHYFIYHDVSDVDIMYAIKNIPRHTLVTSNVINNKNRKKKDFFSGLRHLLRRISGKVKGSPKPDNFSSWCQKNSIQIIHCPYQFIPAVKDINIIPTMHDVQYLHYPGFFSAEDRASFSNINLDIARRADCIIVSYDHIKADLIKYYGVPQEKIVVILLQMDNLWFHKYLQTDCLDLPELIKSKRYLFYPANTWEHKNHIALLQAIASFRDDESLIINLVCTGYITDPYGSYIINKVKELHLQDQVHFLGVVDERLLFSLYKNAIGVVIPTLYEAGSFPLMESIFLEIPVICSNVTSLPETVGNAEFIFDPLDETSLKSKLKELWLDEDFRKRSIASSLIQKKRLSETKALDKIMKAYEDVVLGR